jgi:hypothetical protein
MKDTPAFPQQVQVAADGTTWFDGMTLRDYFAAKAMQGFIGTETEVGMPYDQVTKVAYLYADAMMEARQK